MASDPRSGKGEMAAKIRRIHGVAGLWNQAFDSGSLAAFVQASGEPDRVGRFLLRDPPVQLFAALVGISYRLWLCPLDHVDCRGHVSGPERYPAASPILQGGPWLAARYSSETNADRINELTTVRL